MVTRYLVLFDCFPYSNYFKLTFENFHRVQHTVRWDKPQDLNFNHRFERTIRYLIEINKNQNSPYWIRYYSWRPYHLHPYLITYEMH